MHVTKQQRQKFLQRLRTTPALFVMSLVLVSASLSHGFGVFAADCSSTADCQQQIDNLNAANGVAQNSLNGLAAQASSFQDAINKLAAQISGLQSQISSNQAQQASLQAQIVATQAQIDQEKKVLSNDIKTMYLNGQLTPEEMLATSDNLSDFIDKQQAYSAVQDKIQDTLKQISAQQKTLKDQKVQVDALIVSLQATQSQLAASQAQQASLLAYNQSQQDSFNATIASNKSSLSQLYSKQAAIIAASFGGGIHYGGTGNYPYANAICLNGSGDCSGWSESPYNWGYPTYNPYDEAGWQYRNCTSYAFWRLAQTTGITLTWVSFPSVYNSGGKIKYSPADFRNLGYRVDSDPSGSTVLAVNTAGTFGHIMYVEAVVGGNAVVSQYNAAGDGRYSTATISNPGSIVFVHIR